MRERAKVYRVKTLGKKHTLSKRVVKDINVDEEMKLNDEFVMKRKKGANGEMIPIKNKDTTPLKNK